MEEPEAMIEFGTLTKDEAIRGSMPWARIVCRDQIPTVTLRPSIHPRGLLQWHDSRYDEGLVEAIEETRASWWSNPVTADFRDELLRHDPSWRPGV